MSSTCAASAAKSIAFKKYQGLGNDFILVDNRSSSEPIITPAEAVKLCDRNFGIGADGVIFALPAVGETDLTMRIYNSDGSEPEMCGNGIRCLARFVAEMDSAAPQVQDPHARRHTPVSGITALHPCLDLLVGNHLKLTVVITSLNLCTGTHHQTHLVDSLDLFGIGPSFEKNAVFPAKTNTEFVEVLTRTHVRMIVWERGAGRTLACGTGACAVVVAGVLEGKCDRLCRVDLPGGPLMIEWRESDNHIYMTGPAELAFSGSVAL
ncbi:MAG: hypothetical protein WDW38_007834 [Sanguina aurantia]